MKVIVMGCGRVGSQVSMQLANDGHLVTVIDPIAENLERLDESFKGKKISGIGFDREILIQAGIEVADAFISSSSSDNANIVAARIARNIFHVPRVVARMNDPRQAEIYRRLGLVTISMVAWGSQKICELISHTGLDPTFYFGRGEVSLIAVEIPSTLIGRSVKNITVPGEISVVAITRQGEAMIATLGTEFLKGDLVYLAVQSSAMDRLESMLEL